MKREGGCPNFVPNLWKPHLCSNCLSSHSPSSAPPSPAPISFSKKRASGRALAPLVIPTSPPVLSNNSNNIINYSSSSLSSVVSSQPARVVVEHKRSSSNIITINNINNNKSNNTSSITISSSSSTKLVSSVGSNNSSSSPVVSRSRNNSNLSININNSNNNNGITHSSESAKRKKDPSCSGPCDSFSPQRWRPSVCMHCFEPLHLHPNSPNSRDLNYMTLVNMDISPQDDGNGKDDTILACSIPLPPTPRTPRDLEETLVKLSSLRFSQEKRQQQQQQQQSQSQSQQQHSPSSQTSQHQQQATTPKSTNINSTTPPKPSMTPRSTSAPSLPFFPINSSSLDDDDPFKDFEELHDSSFEKLETVRSGGLKTPRGSSVFSKYKEREDDWEGGVDMDVESFVATAEYSYVNNKIMEIASVKKEAERSQAVLQENPNVVLALFDILQAKQKQIQKAREREKINDHDHSKLIERLNAVKDMLKPNPQGGTW